MRSRSKEEIDEIKELRNKLEALMMKTGVTV
jgi:hypothetical protein